MALLNYGGSLLWRGDLGSSAWANECRSDVGLVWGTGRLITFAGNIEPYSLCNLTNYFVVWSYSQTAGAPGVGANIDRKAVIYFREEGDEKVYHFQYPEPLAADIEVTPWGKRIKSAKVIEVVNLIAYAKNKTLIPLYGAYYQRK